MMRLGIAEKVIGVFRDANMPPDECISILTGLLKTSIHAANEPGLMDEAIAYLQSPLASEQAEPPLPEPPPCSDGCNYGLQEAKGPSRQCPKCGHYEAVAGRIDA